MTQISYQPAVAVAGATGVQGGATARALLAGGVPVRALTRHPDSAAARDLRGAGAQVAYADSPTGPRWTPRSPGRRHCSP